MITMIMTAPLAMAIYIISILSVQTKITWRQLSFVCNGNEGTFQYESLSYSSYCEQVK